MNLDPLVERVARGNPEVPGAILVDAGGTVPASDGLGDQLANVAVALVLPLRDFLDRAAASSTWRCSVAPAPADRPAAHDGRTATVPP